MNGTSFRVKIWARCSWEREWRRSPDNDRTFRFRRSAERYAKTYTGITTIFIPYVFWRSEVQVVERSSDWIDRVVTFLRAPLPTSGSGAGR